MLFTLKGIIWMSIRQIKIIYGQLVVLIILVFSTNTIADDKTYIEEFESIEKRLEYNPDDIVAGNRLREICREQKIISECIDTLNELASIHPNNKNIRYHAALAYVDEVPGHSLFKQGWYSTRSMDHMSAVLENDPGDWSAFYIRGLNGIFWPLSFKRLPGAIRDLKKCIEISDSLPDGLKKSYHVFAYIALGDAYVKNGELDLALQIYKQGNEIQKSEKLEKRLSFDNQKLTQYVKEIRDRNKPVDTDISFLIDGGSNKL